MPYYRSELANEDRVLVLNNAFQTFYLIDDSNLFLLYKTIKSASFLLFFSSLFVKASDAITSLRSYPLDANYMNEVFNGDLDFLTMVGYYWNIEGDNPKGNEATLPTTPTFVVGHYDFPQAQSFMDLDPHIQVQLYLPFMEYIDLPINEIIGKHLSIEYGIDFTTGIGTAYVNIDDGGEYHHNRHTIAIKSKMFAIDIPWNSTNGAENVKNMLTTIGTTAISLYTLGNSKVVSDTAKAVGKFAIASKGAISVVNSLQTRYQRGGSSSGAIILSSPTHPFLIIKKQKLVPINEGLYAHTYGLPLYESRTLNQLTGFTIVDQIHLEGFTTALDEEVNEIERLLKTGVHL